MFCFLLFCNFSTSESSGNSSDSDEPPVDLFSFSKVTDSFVFLTPSLAEFPTVWVMRFGFCITDSYIPQMNTHKKLKTKKKRRTLLLNSLEMQSGKVQRPLTLILPSQNANVRPFLLLVVNVIFYFCCSTQVSRGHWRTTHRHFYPVAQCHIYKYYIFCKLIRQTHAFLFVEDTIR